MPDRGCRGDSRMQFRSNSQIRFHPVSRQIGCLLAISLCGCQSLIAPRFQLTTNRPAVRVASDLDESSTRPLREMDLESPTRTDRVQKAFRASSSKRNARLVDDDTAAVREDENASVAIESDDSRTRELPSIDSLPDEQTGIQVLDDIPDIATALWEDTIAVVSSRNAAILGVAAGGAIALRESVDGEVRAYTAEHPLRWGTGSRVLRQFGEFSYQIPAIAGIYGLSVWTQDEYTHEFSKSLISAYAISSLSTVALKGITDTQRPTDTFQNGRFGFPSFHASSTFAIAAVIDEYFGPWASLPAYALGGMVGWSRIDQREHDLSDVLFGAILGFTVGKTVAAQHVERAGRTSVLPFYESANHSAGFILNTSF